MKFEFRKVELTEINWADASFRISDRDASAALIQAIAELGVFSPPTLIAKSDQYAIVSGFVRLKACQQLGLSCIIARILEPETPLIKCVQLAIAETIFQGELNTVEMARALEMLNAVCNGPDDVLANVKNLGLSINLKLFNKLIAVSKMPNSIKKGLQTGAIALPVALQLNKMNKGRGLDAFCQLLVELNLSLNRQRALFEWVVGISKREGISMEQLLAEEPLQKLCQNHELDSRQKSVQIRQYLHKRRYPSISAYELRYQALNKKLHLKKGARLIAPSNFEGGNYTIQIDFKTLAQMKTMAEEVKRLAHSPHMSKLLEEFKV